MIPNPIKWFELELKRILMRVLLDTERDKRVKKKREQKRSQEGRNHVIYYFHQVDDPYSHLCAQVIPLLKEHYEIEVESYLVPPPTKEAAPQPDLLMRHSLDDAKSIAPYYGLQFPLVNDLPNNEITRIAQSALISLKDYTSEDLIKIGNLLWKNNLKGIEEIITSMPNDDVIDDVLSSNSKLRKKFGHYLGGIFVYEGECYWGIDRLPLLEKRLKKLGLRKNDGPDVVERKSEEMKEVKKLDLEIDVLWSARSPYSYLAMKPLSDLAKKYHLNLNYKIILPMVMRGMKVSLEKRTYITKDCKRIADQNGIPFGNIVDPLGYAVERCYSLYPFAKRHGKEEKYLWALPNQYGQMVNTGIWKRI